jgi:hypothetical protein
MFVRSAKAPSMFQVAVYGLDCSIVKGNKTAFAELGFSNDETIFTHVFDAQRECF